MHILYRDHAVERHTKNDLKPRPFVARRDARLWRVLYYENDSHFCLENAILQEVPLPVVPAPPVASRAGVKSSVTFFLYDFTCSSLTLILWCVCGGIFIYKKINKKNRRGVVEGILAMKWGDLSVKAPMWERPGWKEVLAIHSIAPEYPVSIGLKRFNHWFLLKGFLRRKEVRSETCHPKNLCVVFLLTLPF